MTQRIIKFRAWNPNKKVWIPYADWGDASDHYATGYANGTIELHGNPDYCIYSQFTGLLDKNGKEIYEGDIVKTHFDKTEQYEAYDEIGEVVFTSLEWKIENRCHGNYYRFYSHNEVVGNVHEHPELLNT